MPRNQDLLERLATPLFAIARRQTKRSGLAQLFVPDTGWPFRRVLPYFFNDWTGRRDATRELILTTARREAADRRDALVIGCGAAALVSDFAAGFETAIGID